MCGIIGLFLKDNKLNCNLDNLKRPLLPGWSFLFGFKPKGFEGGGRVQVIYLLPLLNQLILHHKRVEIKSSSLITALIA